MFLFQIPSAPFYPMPEMSHCLRPLFPGECHRTECHGTESVSGECQWRVSVESVSGECQWWCPPCYTANNVSWRHRYEEFDWIFWLILKLVLKKIKRVPFWIIFRYTGEFYLFQIIPTDRMVLKSEFHRKLYFEPLLLILYGSVSNNGSK